MTYQYQKKGRLSIRMLTVSAIEVSDTEYIGSAALSIAVGS